MPSTVPTSHSASQQQQQQQQQKRVTRSSARLSSASSNKAVETQEVAANPPNPPQPPPSSARKRKAPVRESSPGEEAEEREEEEVGLPHGLRRRTKKSKVEALLPSSPSAAPKGRKKTKVSAAMSNAGPSNGPSEDPSSTTPAGTVAASSSKRKSSRQKKDAQAPPPISSSRSTLRPSRKSKKGDGANPLDTQTTTDTIRPSPAAPERQNSTSDDSNTEGMHERYDEEDDPFLYNALARAGGGSLTSLRAMSGVLSGTLGRLQSILEKLKQKDDPSVQLIALQDFSELLMFSTEEDLAGPFSPEPFIKELVSLMQGGDFGDGNPEIMLLACRCIASMMEALPSCTPSVVYGGVIPILCQKLLEIEFIDLAEQSISTLEKISGEFPSAIVREGGLTAILTYLDFFPTGTQRTAVTAAANCCRNIPEESFPVVRDVMEVLLGVLTSADQKVLEQGCLCICRIVQSFKYHGSKLKELVSEDLMKSILRLLLPGTTNLISESIHTQFLSALCHTARVSPERSVELLKMNVVDTLYQILTGVSPPSGTDDVVNKIDKVVIMQALIHRPRDQIIETLNVICELLPNVQDGESLFVDDLFGAGRSRHDHMSMMLLHRKASNEKRLELLKSCKEQLKRFTIVLLPILTDAYSSTVNLQVRQKVLTAQLKMLSNIDADILEEALRNVSYASFLAAILSQQDHPTLVTCALQAAEILLKRLEKVYRYQFYREGVISEIAQLANRPLQVEGRNSKLLTSRSQDAEGGGTTASADSTEDIDIDMDIDHEMQDEDEEDDENSDGEDDGEDRGDHREGNSNADSTPDRPFILGGNEALPAPQNAHDIISSRAKKFIEVHENASGQAMRARAETIQEDLKRLTEEMRSHFVGSPKGDDGLKLFKSLADFFDQDPLESITSYELLSSNLVELLLEVLSSPKSRIADARSSFLEAFMGPGTQMKQKTINSVSTATPFSSLVHKLQDLLSRAEHFEVITVHQNNHDNSKASAASMLAKQLKIKLSATEDSGIPKPFDSVMVSIHAIATFKALDDYLRPRISLRELGGGKLPARALPGGFAAYAAAFAARQSAEGRGPPPSAESMAALAGADLTNRESQSRARKAVSEAVPAQAGSSSVATPPSKRRSNRKPHITQAPPIIPPAAVGSSEPIECNDERQSDEHGLDEETLLDAMVGRLEGDSDEVEEDPSALIEVASSGKVIARKEDGTRIGTPVGSQGPPPLRAGSSSSRLVDRTAPRLSSTPAQTPTSAKPTSYAAALQAVPQNWHIEFSVGGQRISNDTTIYRAVHMNQNKGAEASVNSIWHSVHTINVKRIKGPPPRETAAFLPPPESSISSDGVPASIAQNPTASAILRLLSLLHGLNGSIDDFMISENKQIIKVVSEPSSRFVNTKLTAKLNRQLEEPLIVASNCLPTWSEDLARLYPFIFPFETRYLFLQSTSFGYSRSMTRWQSNQTANESRQERHRDDRPFLGKLQRQKVRISRNKILESAIKVMELYGGTPSVLEVEYFDEVGTGLGPTLEFYSTVSKEFAKKKIKLWRENESQEDSEYAFGTRGLFPAPMSKEYAATENGKRILNTFIGLGRFVARSMLDSRIIDLNFNPTLFKFGKTVMPSHEAVRSVDSGLASSLNLLMQFTFAKRKIDGNGELTAAEKVQAIQDIRIHGARVEDLTLDFTLPGYPSIELVPGGSDVAVTIDNVDEYVVKVLDKTLHNGVGPQITAFRGGFSQVFPYASLDAFTPDELVMLFGGVQEDWTLETLMDSIKADHGFNLDSRTVRNLLQVMSEYTDQDRRNFLQFVSGSPKLPIGGFKALTPMFTVVCKPSEPPYSSDDHLPSVMTCVNYLKLPDYSSLEILRAKLGTAINEGQGAFHLS